jgi:hypothetical protein
MDLSIDSFTELLYKSASGLAWGSHLLLLLAQWNSKLKGEELSLAKMT